MSAPPNDSELRRLDEVLYANGDAVVLREVKRIVDAQQRELEHYKHMHQSSEAAALELHKANMAQQRTVEELRKALEKYAQHLYNVNCLETGDERGYCNCGLKQLLESVKGGKG